MGAGKAGRAGEEGSSPKRKGHRSLRIFALVGLLAIGIALAAAFPPDPAALVAWTEERARGVGFALVALAAQALLFSFALPGSLVFWVIAPFYAPEIATATLVAGSTLGALGGYFVSARLGRDVGKSGLARRMRTALAERGDVLTQMAMRALPGFPHAVLNFSGGALKLPLVGFAVAAAAGLSVKFGVYSTAVYGVVQADSPADALDPATMGPLGAFALVLLAGAAARRRLVGGSASARRS